MFIKGGVALTMKKILVAVLLLISLSASTAMAISPEAQALIEEMRTRVTLREQEPDPKEYVPGSLLSDALVRMRKKVYGHGVISPVSRESFIEPEEKIVTASRQIAEPSSIDICHDYKPGQMLESAMTRVRLVREHAQLRASEREKASQISSDKEGLVVASDCPTEPPISATTYDTSDYDQDDSQDELSEQLQRHSFSMPDSYRIIVK